MEPVVAIGKDTSYYNLYRIPKNTLNVSIGYQATSALFISTQVRAVSKREEFIYGGTPEVQEGLCYVTYLVNINFQKR
jgi:hypothetical protein